MKKILILGATSAIVQAAARIFAERGDLLFLVGRDGARVDAVANDLGVRSAKEIGTLIVDLDDVSRHEEVVNRAAETLGGLDVVLLGYGVLGSQAADQESFGATEKVLRTNFLSPVSFLTILANRFERQRSGTIAVISSVAGDRGRQSNYIYGSSKGALTLFLQGLRNRLARSQVRVVTIKPGFVDTPMTRDFKKGALWASPERVARGIVRAIDRGSDEVYLPCFWRLIMCAIRSIPEGIFKRLKL